MRPHLFLCLSALVLAGCASTPLMTAKNHALVGEKPDGYVGYVSEDLPESTRSLVWRINNERRALYDKIAAEEELPREAVEQIAGEWAMRNTKPGNFIYSHPGGWRRQ